ncbi:carbohydrate-binding module family 13 protein [Cytidiella melzeri]|nr:carbohydrate-binding module family 13 protein [Cytidiella melzeri]
MSGLNSGSIYKFVNAKAGNVMDLSGSDNRSCIGYDWHGGDNQKWRLEKLRDGPGWVVQNVRHGGYLSITENLVDGVSVVCSSDPTQWDIQTDEQDSSVYRLNVLNTRMSLDLADHGNPTPGTAVTLWGQWEGRNQCWRLEPGESLLH